MCEGGGRGGEKGGRAIYYTYKYNGKRESSYNVDPLVSGFGQIYLTVKYI